MNETRLTFHIRFDLHQLLRQEAYEKNITQRLILERALDMYFSSDTPREKKSE